MAISPMFPLWTDAYLGDTHHLSTTEHGAYLLLLITAWRSKDGLLPDEDKTLSKYSRLTLEKWKKIRPILEPFFTIENGYWTQGRLQDERKADFDFRKSQSKKAKARHLKLKDSAPAAACRGHMPPPTPSPTPIILKEIYKENEDLPSGISSDLWGSFLAHRKAKKSPLTPQAEKMAINKLREMDKKGLDAAKVLEECMAQNWKGIYEPKDLTKFKKQQKLLTMKEILDEQSG